MKVGNLTLIKTIGKGTMGEVYLSSKKDSKEYYATKKIKKEYADRPQVKKYFINEISILKKIKHNKIVRLIELKQTPSHYYIVMEYCNGGSLLSCLKKYMTLYKKPFSEEIVQYLMRQIVSGVKYIHEKGIIHRDLKLDNILVKFYSEDDFNKYNMMKTHVKISDFGISAKLGEGKLAHTALGSPAYMDPFILKKLNERNDLANSDGYDQKADIWSLGAMCYEMIMGKRLFTGRNIKDLYKKVEVGNYSLPTHLSKEIVSFLNGMLQYDSKKRLSSKQLMNHAFLTKPFSELNKMNLKDVSKNVMGSQLQINSKKNMSIWAILEVENENEDLDGISPKMYQEEKKEPDIPKDNINNKIDKVNDDLSNLVIDNKKPLKQQFLDAFDLMNDDLIYTEPKLIPIILGDDPNVMSKISEFSEDNF
jgi:serine/threonine protein kinase